MMKKREDADEITYVGRRFQKLELNDESSEDLIGKGKGGKEVEENNEMWSMNGSKDEANEDQ